MTEKTLEYKSWFIMLLSCYWLTKIYEINGIRESTKLFLHAISSGGVPVWMINASIMESMDCSDQHIEPKMFGSTKKASGDFCCVPGCSNQIGNDKMNGWKPLYYRFPKDPNKPAVGWKWSVGIIGSLKVTIGFVLTIL